jgi:hypothetical protein
VHMKLAPHQCHICQKHLGQRGSLGRHLQTVHK